MLTVGITGGIGSGKSTVCKVFKVLGTPVFQADDTGRYLQDFDPSVISRLKALFGDSIYEDGKLNRKKLAGIVFNDRYLLEELNKVIHPAVRKAFEKWLGLQQKAPYILYEAAILFESGNYAQFDCSILVVADQRERIERVKKRDNLTEEAVLSRIRNQMKDEEKIRLSDYIIYNNDNQLIIPEILKLDQLLKERSHVWKMDR